MNGDISVRGLDDAIRNLDRLGDAMERRVAKKAARKAMAPVVPDARKGVPVQYGELRRSIGVKSPRRKRKGEVVISVGPRPGRAVERDGKKHDPFLYGIPVEYGHVTRGGGFVPPAGFMRAAFHRHRDGIVDRFSGELGRLVELELAKVAKAGAA